MPLDGVRTKSSQRFVGASQAGETRGRAKPVQEPQAETEDEATAYEYYASSVELRAAEARRTRAQAAMVRRGLMPDHIANPYPPGTSMVIYADRRIAISVLVLDPIAGMDLGGLEASLLRAGVKPAVVKRAWKANRTEARPAHRFTPALVG